MLTASRVQARGTVRVHNPSPQERDGEWKLKFTINYGGIPHMPHIPMVFSFKPTAIYQRSITDASPNKPITTRKPIVNGTPINLPMDVGFADMTGKIFKITKFGMKLTREADFTAGEYTLTVKLSAGGRMGGPHRIRLRGNNKVIDRRAITFTAKEPAKKPKDEAKDPPPPEDTGPRAAEDVGPDLSDIPDVPDDGTDPDAPPPVPPKQGGCGCRLEAHQAPPAAGWLAAAVLVGLALRRRRGRSEARV